MRPFMALLTGTIFSISTALPAVAQEKAVAISGEIAMELQNDWTHKSDDRSTLNNHLFPTIEPSVTVRLAPNWSVFAHAVAEPVGDPGKFENRVFEDLGLYVEDLYVEFSADRFGAKAGKLNPGFGIAWDRAPGLYGTDIAEDYEISERIGITGSWAVGKGRLGTHSVSGATFFADTTILSQSALRGRGDTRERDGGLSNTESFRSFVVALDGADLPVWGNPGYHIAYMRQAAGAGNASDENSVAAALFASFDLGGGVTFEPLAEAVRQTSQGGTDGLDRTYLTVSGQVGWSGWNFTVSWTERDSDNPAAATDTDSHFQLSAGYEFDFGLAVDIGWKVSEDSGTETRTLGAIAAYTIKF